MSHFPVLVLVPDETPLVPKARPTLRAAIDRVQVTAHVERVLEPYCERDGHWGEEGTRLDWWVIGGRWTGALTDSYDPALDPTNLEVCDLCEGTGTRDWTGLDHITPEHIEACNGCNGCKGHGQRLRWDFLPYEGDVTPASTITTFPSSFVPHAVVTPDGTWHERERRGMFGMTLESDGLATPESPGDWILKVEGLIRDHADGIVAVVDCHV